MLVLDLVKQTERREREVIVGREYRQAVEHVNSTMPPVSDLDMRALAISTDHDQVDSFFQGSERGHAHVIGRIWLNENN